MDELRAILMYVPRGRLRGPNDPHREGHDVIYWVTKSLPKFIPGHAVCIGLGALTVDPTRACTDFVVKAVGREGDQMVVHLA